MSNIAIINGHQPFSVSPGGLNAALTERARDLLSSLGHAVRVTTVADGYDVEEEIGKHLWANAIIFQYPVDSMSVPWILKKYMDEIYTAAMDGRFSRGDGRRSHAPKANYGTGGLLTDTHYMLSMTFNAPREAFDNPAEPFFAGASVDDLMRPVHLNAKFYGMTALPTFAAFDVRKNPTIDEDFARYDDHLRAVFGTAGKNVSDVAA